MIPVIFDQQHRNLGRVAGRSLAAYALLASIFLFPGIVLAANGPDTWLGQTDGYFSNAANWDPASTNQPPISGDSWVFGASGAGGSALTNDLGDGSSVAGITFNDGATAYTISGHSIVLTGSVTNNDADTQTINLDMTMAATRTFTGTGNITVGGVLSGAGGLTKSGSGTLTLMGANTYDGSTSVSGGPLELGAGASISSNAGLTVNTGSLNITGGASVITPSDATVTGSTGTVTVDGPGSTWTACTTSTKFFTIGNYSAGVLNIQNGAVVTNSGKTRVAMYAGSRGSITVDGEGSIWNDMMTGGDSFIGRKGNGEVIISNGGMIYTATSWSIGVDAGAVGTLEVRGAGSNFTSINRNLYGGLSATGAITVEDGGLIDVGTAQVRLGYSAVGARGELNIGSGADAGTVKASAIAGNLGTGTVNFNHNEVSYTFATPIIGPLSVNHLGIGKTVLSGESTYTGPTTVSAGTLAYSRSVSLGGAVINNGTLSLGANTLNLTGGAYTQNLAASTLEVSILGASNFGRIVATGANADVSNGKVAVTLGGEYIAGGTAFMIVDGAAGGTITPASLQVTSNSPRVNFIPTALNGDLILTANRADTSYDKVAVSGNASAAGAVLESVGAAGATGDMLDVLSTLDGLSNEDLNHALEMTTPDVSGGNIEGSRAMMDGFLFSVGQRLGYSRSGLLGGVSTGDMFQGTGFWIQGLGSHAKQGSRKGFDGFNVNTWGTTIGVDQIIAKHLRAGVAGGYSFAKVKAKSPGSPSSGINSFQAMIYGSFDSLDLCKGLEERRENQDRVLQSRNGSWYVDGMLGFGSNLYESRREIWLTPVSARVAKADHYGQQYSTKWETGYTLTTKPTKALEVTPFASLEYSYLRMNRYKERGADALNLTIEGEGSHTLEQGLGLKLAYPLVFEKIGTFVPAVRGAWLHDYMADKFETTSSFAGGGTSFTSSGSKPAREGVVIGAELAFLNKGNMTLTGHYDCTLRDRYSNHTYYLTARFDLA